MHAYIVILITVMVLFFVMSPVLAVHSHVGIRERLRFALTTTFFLAFAIVVIESVFNVVNIYIGW